MMSIESHVSGLKYFEQLRPLLEGLHASGTARDRAGNRQLHMDQYCMLVLLFLFNPTVSSLRAIQQASQLKKVQRKLGCPRTSLGSLSEASRVFDPELLRDVIRELSQQLKPQQSLSLGEVEHVLTAVDGSLFQTLCTITEAAYLRTPHRHKSESAWRLHTHFEIDRYVPVHVDVTGGRNSGKSDEKTVLRRNLEADRCYVMDRWFAQFSLFNDIDCLGSSYVCRIRDNTVMQVVQTNSLSAAAIESRVTRDEIVQLGSSGVTKPDHPVRVIWVKATPHTKQRGRKGEGSAPSCDGYLRIATNLVNVPAEIIAKIYQHRWTVEIFFRFLKHILGCRHLLSTCRQGIEIQMYMAVIACLLISLWTGKKPSLRTYEMICYYLTGLADIRELQAHLKHLPDHA